MPQARADEITYYDELGIARNATPEQVREAFRSLVRLLHPDQHTDEQLKAVAEVQMRKLNRIYSVLSDSERRRAYDDLLDEERGPGAPLMSEKLSNLRSSRNVGRFAWVGAVIVVIVLLTWLASDGPGVVTLNPSDRILASTSAPAETGAKVPDLASELARAKAELKVARFERDTAVRELERIRGRASSSVPASPPEIRHYEPPPAPQIRTMTELPSAPTATSASTGGPTFQAPSPRAPQKPLSGFWFYLRTPEDKKNPGLYPPDFIEATITEQGGQVKGRYRSRYRIVDRAISPDVNFDFNGKLAGNMVSASWTGPGGAHGDLTIRILSENSLRVDWSADQLGSIQGLTSGTAALTRRLD